MSIMESVMDIYYVFSHEVLLISSIVFAIVIICGLIFWKENIRYFATRIIYKVLFALVIIGIGEIFCLIGLPLAIDYVYFNVFVFILFVGFIILYELVKCVMFKEIIYFLLQGCTYIKYVIYLELFWLAASSHLEISEGIAGILGIAGFEAIQMVLNKIESRRNEKSEEEIRKRYDYENPDLYYTREQQLKRFVQILEQQKLEPYAIMISGEWGVGKSSFIKALEKRLEQDSFIWVRTGSEKTFSETMLEISEQILDVLKKNNIYVESSGLIEQYFLAFSDLFKDTKLELVRKFANILKSDKNIIGKEYINNKLTKLKSTIYLVIDDLDRCDDEYQTKMFKVIRESTDLYKCKTLFLVDKAKFLKRPDDENYIEKYISYTLDLCDVNYSEIARYYLGSILEDEFIQNMNSILLKDRNVDKVKQMIYEFPSNLLERFENEKQKVDRETNKDNKKYIEDKIDDINSIELEIKNNIKNSRKVKNFFKGIQRDISSLNEGIDQCSGEYLKEDWLLSIIKVQFVKNFLPMQYSEIKLSNDLLEFGENYAGYAIELIFDLKSGFLLPREKTITVLNYLIYKVDVIDFRQVRTIEERYLTELRSGEGLIEHVNEYVDYAKSYDDLDMIIKICKTDMFENAELKEQFIEKILDVLSKQTIIWEPNTPEFLEFSELLVDWLKKCGLSEAQKYVCIHKGELIVRRVIVDNTHLFRNILYILFGITKVEEKWEILSVTTIDEFYAALTKIDNDSRFQGLEDNINKLLSIKTYFFNIGIELKKDKYQSMEINFEELFTLVEIVFSILELWNNIEDALYDEKDDNDEQLQEFKDYFTSGGSYSFKETVFANVSHMIRALKALKAFYESKTDNYNKNDTYILLRLSHSMVKQYEYHPEWYDDEGKEIAELLNEIKDLVIKLDNSSDQEGREVIFKCKLYAYKFNEYIETENNQ